MQRVAEANSVTEDIYAETDVHLHWNWPLILLIVLKD